MLVRLQGKNTAKRVMIMAYKADFLKALAQAKLLLQEKDTENVHFSSAGMYVCFNSGPNKDFPVLMDYRNFQQINRNDRVFPLGLFKQKYIFVNGFAVDGNMVNFADVRETSNRFSDLRYDYAFFKNYTVFMVGTPPSSKTSSVFYPYTQKRHFYHAYVIVDNKTGKIIANRKVPFVANSENILGSSMPLLRNEYPFIVFNSYSKVMYTVLPLQNGRKKIIIDFLKDNGIDTHVVYADAVYVDKFNLNPRVYGASWKGDKIEIVSTVGQDIVKRTMQIQEKRTNETYIRQFLVGVFDRNNLFARVSFGNIKKDQRYGRRITFTSNSMMGDSGFSLTDNIYYSVAKGSYIVTDSKGNKIGAFKPAFSLKGIDLWNNRKDTVETITDIDPVYYNSTGALYDVVVMKGKENFAVVEWLKGNNEEKLFNAVSVYDKKGNLLKQFKGSMDELVVLTKQDFNGKYVYFTRPARDTFKPELTASEDRDFNLTFTALNIDTVKTLDVPINARRYFYYTTVNNGMEKADHKFDFNSLNRSLVTFLTRGDRLVIYHMESPLEIKLAGMVDFANKKSFSAYNIFHHDIYLSDPLIATGIFNAYTIDEVLQMIAEEIKELDLEK
jgi:hypothetical protein